MTVRDTAVATLGLIQRFTPRLATEAAYVLWLSSGLPKQVHPREQAIIDEATRSTIRVNGNRIAVYTWGGGPNTVLLTHGWHGRAADFGDIVQELRRGDRTIIAFDAPGHGESRGRLPDVRDFAATIEALGHRYGPFEAMVAHSFGNLASTLAIRDETWVPYGQAEVLAAAHPETSRTMLTSGLNHHRVLRDEQVLDAITLFLSESDASAV
jgi:pimeloyl-ACP methyl ester carboxylesterase